MYTYMLNKIQIVNKIACGSEGSVYEIIYKKKKRAMKITHIKKSDNVNNTSSIHWREINFSNKMYKKYPNHFMKLHYYATKEADGINYTCMNLEDLYPVAIRKKYLKLIYNGDLSIKIYDFIDYNLEQIINKLTKKQIISGIIQIAYIVYLLRKNNFINIDMGPQNIGIVATTDKYIKIMGKLIPTFGFRYVLIDYGKILNPNYVLSSNEKKLINDNKKYKFDMFSIKYMLTNNFNNRYDYTKAIFYDYDEMLANYNKNKIKDKINKYTDDINLQLTFCELLYPKIYQKIILKNTVKNFTNNVTLVDKTDIIFILLNIDNPLKIINHCSTIL
jgi:hypothetical protein